MAQEEATISIEQIKNKLLVVSQKVQKGELSATTGNSIANILRTALYAEQLRYQQEKGLEVKLEQNGETELSEADRARLDKIAKLLSGEPSKKSRKK